MTDADMSLDAVRRMADAVLYEGYILYPYRASAQKNRSRWQFGVVMAPQYAAADPSERSFTQTECALEHAGQPEVQVVLRFLQVQRRSTDPVPPDAQVPAWDEAVEREIEFTVSPDELLGPGLVAGVLRAGRRGPRGAARAEHRAGRPPPLPSGRHGFRAHHPGRGPVAGGPAAGPGGEPDRGRARPHRQGRGAAVRAGRRAPDPDHLRRGVHLHDRPAGVGQGAVAECENVGSWPVLADPDGGRQVVLSSPIILYDHPELAPESPGELYDGTEIDEILTLRTLALSDEEKLEARATDPRAAALIDRVESMDAADHAEAARHHPRGRAAPARSALPAGAGLRHGRPDTFATFGTGGLDAPVGYDPETPWWDPEADASVSPETDSVLIGGQQVARGSLVRLQPGVRRADAQDMFLAGRIAEVQAVLTDVEDRPYLAVSLADDPDADLRIAHGRFLYFMPDEVAPIEAGDIR